MSGAFGRLARNAASLMASGLLDRAATLVFYGVIARNPGVEVYGQVSLGLTVVNAFQVLSTTAMRNSIAREIAQQRQPVEKTVAAGLLVVAALSSISLLALNLILPVLGYSAATTAVVLLLGLLVVPTSFGAVFEGVLHGREQMQFVALANAPMQALRVIGAIALFAAGYAIDAVIWLLIASYTGIALIEAAVCFRKFLRPASLMRAFDSAHALRLGAGSWGFVGVDFAVAAANAALYVLISKIAGEAQLGVFNAATQVISLMAMLRIPVVTGAFPVLCKQVVENIDDARATALKLIRLLLMVMLPAAVGLFFFGAQAFEILQDGGDFTAGVSVLQIIVITLVGMTLTGVFGQVVLASGQERWIVLSVLAYGAITLGLSALLLPRIGALGAAIAMTAGHLVDAGLHLVLARRALKTYALWPAIWPAALATSAMTLAIVAMRAVGVPPYPAIALAIIVYALAAFAILYRSEPKLRALIARQDKRQRHTAAAARVDVAANLETGAK